MQELLDEGFVMVGVEDGRGRWADRRYFKAGFIELMTRRISPALPDFSWSAATSGATDAEGWAIVTVSVRAGEGGGVGGGKAGLSSLCW